MDQLSVDIDQRRTIVALLDYVGIPQFIIESLTGHLVPHSINQCVVKDLLCE